MSSIETFVKVDFDESALNARLEETDEKIQEHDELIKQILEKLKNIPDVSLINSLQDSITKNFESQINELNKKYQTLSHQYNDVIEQIKGINERLDSKINGINEYFDNKIQKTYDDILSAATQDKTLLSSLEERIYKCEEELNDNKTKVDDLYDCTKGIADAFAFLNDSEVVMDRTLPGKLKESSYFVKYNLQRLFDELNKLKGSQLALEATCAALAENQEQQANNMNNTNNMNTKGQRKAGSGYTPQITTPQVQNPRAAFSQTAPKVTVKPISMLQPASNFETPMRPKTPNRIEKPAITEITPKVETNNENVISRDFSGEPPSNENKEEVNHQLPQKSEKTNKINLSNIANSYNNPGMILSPYQHQALPPPSQPITIEKPSMTFVQQPATTNFLNSIPYDLNSVRPYKTYRVHWKDEIILPEVKPFQKIEEVVDYIYLLYPSLQAYLTAIHTRLIEDFNNINKKMDKDLVEKMFAKFQSIINDIRETLNELKKEISLTASRDEINELLNDMFRSIRSDAQTAAGRVRCIACGRESAQITGAMTDAEIARALGTNPPNSIFRSNGDKYTHAFTTRDHFDSAIIESPRSKRPPQLFK